MKIATQQKLQSAALETLEDRRLMSAVLLDHGMLTLVGDSTRANHLSVEYDGKGAVHAQVNGVGRDIPAWQVSRLRIYGGAKNDSVFVSPKITVDSYIQTGSGDDVVLAGGGDSTIFGGDGNDSLVGSLGHNYIYGGAGNDTLVGGTQADSLRGGLGNDAIDGGDGDDFITGGGGNDSLRGQKGNDTVYGGAHGDDLVNGNKGSNHLGGGPDGRDTLVGGNGASAPIVAPTIPQAAQPAAPVVETPTPSTPSTPSTPATTKSTTPAAAPTAPATTLPVITNPTPAYDSHVAAPTPVINMIGSSGAADRTIHVSATDSALGTGTALTAAYHWNFGDAAAQYNELDGYNAAHLYTKPGTYDITLTITNEGGRSATLKRQVTIADDTRKVIYVDSAGGNDANSGLSANAAVASIGRANALLGDNTRISFKRGQSYVLNSTWFINASEVVIGAYGTGENPRLVGTFSGSALISGDVRATSTQHDVMLENLTFDSTALVRYQSNNNAVSAAGTNFTVRNSTFLNVYLGVGAIGKGFMMLNSTAPNGLGAYMAWLSGSDHVLLGNSDAGSFYEHDFRGSPNRTLIAYNTLTNAMQDGSHVGQTYGTQKGSLWLMDGQFAYVAHNTFQKGSVLFGPLGAAPPRSSAEAAQRLNWAVVENNNVRDGSEIRIKHGTNHISVRDNVILRDNETGIMVEGYSADWQRGITDLHITGNTAFNYSTQGKFVLLAGPVSGVVIQRNLYVAPNVQNPGGIVALVPNASCFSDVSQNVWQLPTAMSGKDFYILSSWYNTAGELSTAQWEALPQVHDELFVFNANLLGGTQYQANGYVAGAKLA